MELRTSFSRQAPEAVAASSSGDVRLGSRVGALGAREGLATILGLIGILVLTAPASRLTVPVGAPGSTLPNWILGIFSPMADTGLWLGRPAVAGGLVLATAAWLLVVRDVDSVPLRTLVWAIGAIYVLLLLAPPLFSTDVFTYLSAGRLQVLHSVNPYLHGPVVRPQDPVFGWTGLIWCDTPTVYGPIFTLFTVALTPLGVAGGLWALKLVAFASAGTCAWLTYKIARDLGRPAAQAMVFVALNPVLLVYALGGGHNDLLMLAVVLAAVRLVVQSRPRAAGAALAVAVAVKATAGLVLPFLLIGSRKSVDRGTREALLGFTMVTAAVAAVATLFYGGQWLTVPATIADGTGQHIGELRSVPGIFAGYLGLGQVGVIPRTLLFLVVLSIIVLSARAALRTKNGWIGGAAVAIIASLALSTQLHPWYLIWCLPFAALSGNRRIRGGAIALTVGVIAIQAIRWLAPLGVGWAHSG